MKRLEYHSHTADVRLTISADSIAELLQAGLEGMAGILQKDICQQAREPDVRQKLVITSMDSTSLMIEFLSEVLTFCHIHSAIFCQMEIGHLTPNSFEGEVLGHTVPTFEDDIKAVTYHEADVTESNGIFSTNVIFDI